MARKQKIVLSDRRDVAHGYGHDGTSYRIYEERGTYYFTANGEHIASTAPSPDGMLPYFRKVTGPRY